MKKIIKLTENQLFGMIQKALNENVATGMLRYGSDDAQINSEEDLDKFLSQHRSADFKDLIASKINMGDWIVHVGYAPYGNVGDWAVVEFFKQFNPNNIVTEYAYNGGGAQSGFIWGSEEFLNSEIETATDQYLADMECKLVNDKIEELEQFYGKEFNGQLRDDVFDYLFQCVCADRIDYSEKDLEDILNEAGYFQEEANESFTHRVMENVLRALNEWDEDDWSNEEEGNDEDDEPNVQYFADLLEWFDPEVVLNELEQYLSKDDEDALIDSLIADWDVDYQGIDRENYQYLTDLTELRSPENLLSDADSYFGREFSSKAAQDIMHTLWWN